MSGKTKPARARPKPPAAGDYDLVLYISGATAHSKAALANIKGVAEARLSGRYRLAVVDLYQHGPDERGHDIMVAPTLVRALPLPLRHIVGDLASEDRVLIGLGLEPRKAGSAAA